MHRFFDSYLDRNKARICRELANTLRITDYRDLHCRDRVEQTTFNNAKKLIGLLGVPRNPEVVVKREFMSAYSFDDSIYPEIKLINESLLEEEREKLRGELRNNVSSYFGLKNKIHVFDLPWTKIRDDFKKLSISEIKWSIFFMSYSVERQNKSYFENRLLGEKLWNSL